jgi:hypothetical protein
MTTTMCVSTFRCYSTLNSAVLMMIFFSFSFLFLYSLQKKSLDEQKKKKRGDTQCKLFSFVSDLNVVHYCMSSITIILIILINHIFQLLSINQCDLLSSTDLQSATYSHSVILHVQPIYSSDENDKNLIIRKVLVREVIKISTISSNQVKINDMIIIRIDNDLDEILEDSCWHLLRITNIDIILFLNDTNNHQFDLRYPPVESTLRVRQNIDSVINYGK